MSDRRFVVSPQQPEGFAADPDCTHPQWSTDWSVALNVNPPGHRAKCSTCGAAGFDFMTPEAEASWLAIELWDV